MSMIEKLVLALFDEISNQSDNATVSLQGGRIYVDGETSISGQAMVTAVLLALREPDEGMMAAGEAADDEFSEMDSHKAVFFIWRAMINSILPHGKGE